MNQLSAANLPDNIRAFDYDRKAVTAGIVHFGIGNFHRAHQAVYIDDLLATGATQWGITGVSLRSSSMQDALQPQDYLYTLATLSETTEYRIIGAIKDVLVAPHTPQAVIDLLAKPATQLVSSTITEKGYCLGSGKVDFNHADLKAEAASLAAPKTIYGFLTRGIIARFQSAPQAKLTIMCCDNISAGGEFLKDGVEHLLGLHDAAALAWSQTHVGFVSSMVDRVCPATDDALREKVRQDTQRSDAWPVSAEPFTQWIIEGGFTGERPEFDKVGAVFVDDIVPFERMKLRYLNAAHTIASTLGHLSGDRYVHEALQRPELFKFMVQTLHQNVLPYAAVPYGYDGASYIEAVIERFENGNLPYANLQVGTDSSQKIQQRWFPTIDQALGKDADCSHYAFCLAAWALFIQDALEKDVLNDPKKDALKQVKTDNLDRAITDYLTIANGEQFAFFAHTSFIQTVKTYAADIQANGIKRAIESFLSAQD